MGPFLVAIAALLWATDTVFRYPLVQHALDPIFIVFSDHLIAVIFLAPWLWLKKRKLLTKITLPQWLALTLVGGGASALATIFFVASFRYVNPSVSILLQKLQPILVVCLAMVFLGERPKKGFWIWACVAVVSGLALSFPSFDFSFAREITLQSKGTLYALLAAGLWAAATVIGKRLLIKLDPLVVTFWRFVFGLGMTTLLLGLGNSPFPAQALTEPKVIFSLFYIALITGALAMILYYRGMVKTNATTVTMMELLFPVAAVTINTFYLDLPLSQVQIGATLILLFSVTKISTASRK